MHLVEHNPAQVVSRAKALTLSHAPVQSAPKSRVPLSCCRNTVAPTWLSLLAPSRPNPTLVWLQLSHLRSGSTVHPVFVCFLLTGIFAVLEKWHLQDLLQLIPPQALFLPSLQLPLSQLRNSTGKIIGPGLIQLRCGLLVKDTMIIWRRM